MCLQCATDAEDVFKDNSPSFLPGYTIMIASKNDVYDEWLEGEIGLVHHNDPSCIGRFTIAEELCGLNYDDFCDKKLKLSYVTYDYLNVNPNLGHDIICKATEVGYNEELHGLFELWFLHRLHEFYEYLTDKAIELMVVKK